MGSADSPAVVNPQFLDLAGYYGFEVDACAPYRAQTKGKIERLVGFVKDNFYLGREFTSLEDMNHKARLWCDEVNSRVHGTTGKVPFEELEKEGLVSTAGRDYDTSRISARIVARDCFMSYEGNRYEAPYRLVGKAVVVKDDDDGRIAMLLGDEMVVEHRKVDGKAALQERHRLLRLLLSTFSGQEADKGVADPKIPVGGSERGAAWSTWGRQDTSGGGNRYGGVPGRIQLLLHHSIRPGGCTGEEPQHRQVRRQDESLHPAEPPHHRRGGIPATG